MTGLRPRWRGQSQPANLSWSGARGRWTPRAGGTARPTSLRLSACQCVDSAAFVDSECTVSPKEPSASDTGLPPQIINRTSGKALRHGFWPRPGLGPGPPATRPGPDLVNCDWTGSSTDSEHCHCE